MIEDLGIIHIIIHDLFKRRTRKLKEKESIIIHKIIKHSINAMGLSNSCNNIKSLTRNNISAKNLTESFPMIENNEEQKNGIVWKGRNSGLLLLVLGRRLLVGLRVDSFTFSLTLELLGILEILPLLALLSLLSFFWIKAATLLCLSKHTSISIHPSTDFPININIWICLCFILRVLFTSTLSELFTFTHQHPVSLVLFVLIVLLLSLEIYQSLSDFNPFFYQVGPRFCSDYVCKCFLFVLVLLTFSRRFYYDMLLLF